VLPCARSKALLRRWSAPVNAPFSWPNDARAGVALPERSSNRNETLDPTDSKYRLPDLFRSYTVSTGIDVDVRGRSGVGFQYALVDTREPDHHTREHYLNLAATYWIEDSVAIGGRGSIFAQQLSGEPMATGSRSLFITGRLVLQ
jgi:hypothetical protein